MAIKTQNLQKMCKKWVLKPQKRQFKGEKNGKRRRNQEKNSRRKSK